MFRFSFTLVLCIPVLVLSHGDHHDNMEMEKPEFPRLLLVSFDGFRHDYISRTKSLGGKTPNFDDMIKYGVSAQAQSVFVTKTFPNHFSIVTGMYAENHGVVANDYYDPVFNETFHSSDEKEAEEARWWNNGTKGAGGEPIWVTNIKFNAERKSCVIFWPGCSGTVPVETNNYKCVPYKKDVELEARVTDVKNCFNDGFNFVAVYFDEPDHTGHIYGPDNESLVAVIERLDRIVGYIVDELKKAEVYSDMNIIITSDHGMTSIKDVIEMDKYIDPSLYTTYFGSPLWHIYPNEAKDEEVYEKLKKVPNLSVYWKKDIPREYHYSYNRRIGPIVIVADEGYDICFSKDNDGCLLKGNHGYNNSLPDMRALFLAHGPAFIRSNGEPSALLYNVDFYALMCHLLGIQPHTNDGSFNRICHILLDGCGLMDLANYVTTTMVTYLLTVMFCATITSVCCIATCRAHHRYRRHTNRIIKVTMNNSGADGSVHLLAEDDEELP